MKTATTAMQGEISSEVTHLAMLWRVIRADGQVLGFTDHDTDITYGGTTYEAATSYTRTNVSSDDTLAVDNCEVDGVLDSLSITDQDIRNGLYDFAAVELRVVNWSDLTQGEVKIRKGYLGNISILDWAYRAELRGLMQRLSRRIVEVTSPTCRAELGDGRCKVNLAAFTFNGTVSKVIDQLTFQATGTILGKGSDYYAEGILTWLTGNNATVAQEVKSYIDGVAITGGGGSGSATVTGTFGGGTGWTGVSGLQLQTWSQDGATGDSAGHVGAHGTYSWVNQGDGTALINIYPASPYDDFFWHYVIPGKPSKAPLEFKYHIEFMFPTGQKALSQAVEFQLQFSDGHYTYNMAWQAELGSNLWRYFHYIGQPGGKWISSGITIGSDVTENVKTVVDALFSLDPVAGTCTHVSLTVNGVTHAVNVTQAAVAKYQSNYLHAGFQLDSKGTNPPPAYKIVLGQTTASWTNTAVTGNGSVSGIVLDDATGLPISGATVSYSGGSTTTAADGSYSFATVPAGAYTFTFSKAGYANYVQDTAISNGTVDTINVRLATGSTSGSSSAPATFTFKMPSVGLIQVGDTFTAEAGCNHKLDTCQLKFNNVINFHGEPFIPTQDKIYITPNADGSVPQVGLSTPIAPTSGTTSGGLTMDVTFDGVTDNQTWNFKAQTSFNIPGSFTGCFANAMGSYRGGPDLIPLFTLKKNGVVFASIIWITGGSASGSFQSNSSYPNGIDVNVGDTITLVSTAAGGTYVPALSGQEFVIKLI